MFKSFFKKAPAFDANNPQQAAARAKNTIRSIIDKLSRSSFNERETQQQVDGLVYFVLTSGETVSREIKTFLKEEQQFKAIFGVLKKTFSTLGEDQVTKRQQRLWHYLGAEKNGGNNLLVLFSFIAKARTEGPYGTDADNRHWKELFSYFSSGFDETPKKIEMWCKQHYEWSLSRPERFKRALPVFERLEAQAAEQSAAEEKEAASFPLAELAALIGEKAAFEQPKATLKELASLSKKMEVVHDQKTHQALLASQPVQALAGLLVEQSEAVSILAERENASPAWQSLLTDLAEKTKQIEDHALLRKIVMDEELAVALYAKLKADNNLEPVIRQLSLIKKLDQLQKKFGLDGQSFDLKKTAIANLVGKTPFLRLLLELKREGHIQAVDALLAMREGAVVENALSLRELFALQFKKAISARTVLEKTGMCLELVDALQCELETDILDRLSAIVRLAQERETLIKKDRGDHEVGIRLAQLVKAVNALVAQTSLDKILLSLKEKGYEGAVAAFLNQHNGVTEGNHSWQQWLTLQLSQRIMETSIQQSAHHEAEAQVAPMCMRVDSAASEAAANQVVAAPSEEKKIAEMPEGKPRHSSSAGFGSLFYQPRDVELTKFGGTSCEDDSAESDLGGSEKKGASHQAEREKPGVTGVLASLRSRFGTAVDANAAVAAAGEVASNNENNAAIFQSVGSL